MSDPSGFDDQGTEALIQELDLPSTDRDTEISVRRLDDEHRFVAVLDDVEIASIHYRDEDGRTAILSTFVDPEFRGMGIAAAFIADVLDDIREMGRHVIPLCPVVAAFIAGNQQYSDLVD